MNIGKSSAILLILLIVFLVSGCVEDFGDFGFNSDFEGVQTQENIEEETADILVIQDITTIPKSPIPPGQDFELMFTIKNLDEHKTVKNIEINLFDPSIFTVTGSDKETITSLLPLGQKIITFSLKTPSAEDIANVKVTPTVSFNVKYDFTGTTTYDVVVVDMKEIEKQQKAGKKITPTINKIIGSGPIKIYPELIGTDIILAGRTGSIKFLIKNEGRGDLEENKVAPNKLTINFERLVDGGGDVTEVPDGFDEGTKSNTKSNNKEIELYQGESSPLIFKVKAPSKSELGGAPYKTFNIKADVNYTYELRGEMDITVEPIE